MDRRNRFAIKADALLRKVMWHTLSARLPLILVPEYPKSGGTWLSMMLADYLALPCPRNRFPVLGASVMHGHHLYSPSFRNVFCLIRDGRDVMVSYYFHLLFEHDRNDPRLVESTRRALGLDAYDDVRANLPRFIEYVFTHHDRGRFRFTWSEFVRSWHGKGIHIVKYEDLLEDASGTLATALRRVLGLEPDAERLRAIEREHSFENLTKRKKGQEDQKNFLRKGIAGDWKEKFSAEAREVFDRFAGDELILAGYENDRVWLSGRSPGLASGPALPRPGHRRA
jgi:hypothetical protein